MKRLWPGFLLVTSACASVPADGGRAEVADLAGERLSISPALADGSTVNDGDALAEPLTAERVVRLAWRHNAEVRAAFASLGVARADILAASAWSNPRVEGEVLFSEDGDDTTLGFSLVQDVTSLFYASARGAGTRAELRAAQAEALAQVLRVAFDARRAFIGWQAAAQRSALAGTALLAADAAADAARALHGSGNFTDLELYTELDAAERARLSAHRAAVEEVRAREQVSAAIGVAGAWHAAAVLPEPPAHALDVVAIERAAVENSAALAALRDRSAATRSRASYAGARGWLPSIEVGVAAEREDERWRVGPVLELELPLFDQGQGARARASAEAERYVALEEAGAVQLRAEVRGALALARAAQERLTHLRGVVQPLRARLLDETQRAVNAMSASVFQLLQAKTAQVEAERATVDALEELWLARAAIDEMAAGGGGAVSAAPRTSGEVGAAPAERGH
jgi:cobalt-zinc-cadmium efflux system outer membrane protein